MHRRARRSDKFARDATTNAGKRYPGEVRGLAEKNKEQASRERRLKEQERPEKEKGTLPKTREE